MWRGHQGGNGYGKFTVRGRTMNAARATYLLFYGFNSLDGGREACHTCDTPLCVRPDHLFAGTHAENMRDGVRKGRFANRLKPEYWRGLLDRLESGESKNALAREYGITRQAIIWQARRHAPKM
jgi:hypothetical protein